MVTLQLIPTYGEGGGVRWGGGGTHPTPLNPELGRLDTDGFI